MSEKELHNDFEALCAGYVLGSLSEEDRLQFLEMLEKATPEQKAIYKEMQLAGSELALTVDPMAPSPEVRNRIMDSLGEKDDDHNSSGSARIIPLNFYRAAAAILLMVFLGLAYYSFELNQTVEQQETTITQLKDDLERQEQFLDILAAREVNLVIMGGLEPSPDGYGKILWDSNENRAVLQLANLPAPPSDKDYQLWLIKDGGNPISAGVFSFDEPRSDLFFRVEHLDEAPSPLENTFAVTLEPKGGVPQPTGDMYLVGQQQ